MKKIAVFVTKVPIVNTFLPDAVRDVVEARKMRGSQVRAAQNGRCGK